MIPVLFTIYDKPVSSFGVFLALGFLYGVFLIWRLSRAWDLDEEKVLDLTLYTFLGGLIGARLYFALENPQVFSGSIFKILLINKYTGFSFWGAILGGWLTLFLISRLKKLDFWQICDIGSIGLLGGLILADVGCFLGGCGVGIKSNLFLAVNMVGFVGKRFPTQILESLLLIVVLSGLWSQAKRFHPHGKVISLALIYIGIIKFFTEFLKDKQTSGGLYLSFVLAILGAIILFRVTKRNLLADLKGDKLFISKFFSSSETRKNVLAAVSKYWYNQKTLIVWKLKNFKKSLRKKNA